MNKRTEVVSVRVEPEMVEWLESQRILRRKRSVGSVVWELLWELKAQGALDAQRLPEEEQGKVWKLKFKNPYQLDFLTEETTGNPPPPPAIRVTV